MISVCIATFNGERYIQEQLESILSQLCEEDEVVISDDNSSDQTLSIVRTIAQTTSTKIRIYKNNSSLGYVANFEKALSKAKGEIIFLSDQDDVWLPNKVQRCLKALHHVDLVAHDALIVSGKLDPTGETFYQKRKPATNLVGTFIRFAHIGCCLCFKRAVLDKALPFPPNHLFCTHDNWIYLVAETFFKTTILRETLLLYRRHENNTSLGADNEHNSTFFRIAYRCYLIFSILRRAFKK